MFFTSLHDFNTTSHLLCVLQVTPSNAYAPSTGLFHALNPLRILRQSSIQPSITNGWTIHVFSLFQSTVWVYATTDELFTTTIATLSAIQCCKLIIEKYIFYY